MEKNTRKLVQKRELSCRLILLGEKAQGNEGKISVEVVAEDSTCDIEKPERYTGLNRKVGFFYCFSMEMAAEKT